MVPVLIESLCYTRTMKVKGVGTLLPISVHAKRGFSGFTIVELLIVVVVIAILAAITIISYNGIQQRAKVTAKKAELSQLQRKIQTDILQMTGATISIKTPIVLATSIGATDLTEPLQAAQEVTLYGIFDSLNNTAAAGWTTIIGLTPNASDNAFRLRSGASGSDTGRAYYATSGETNKDLTKNGILNNTNRHVGWLAANASNIYASFDTQNDSSASLVAHSGWNFSSVTLYSNSITAPVAALVFPEYHDAATRAQIVQWLATKYPQ